MSTNDIATVRVTGGPYPTTSQADTGVPPNAFDGNMLLEVRDGEFGAAVHISGGDTLEDSSAGIQTFYSDMGVFWVGAAQDGIYEITWSFTATAWYDPDNPIEGYLGRVGLQFITADPNQPVRNPGTSLNMVAHNGSATGSGSAVAWLGANSVTPDGFDFVVTSGLTGLAGGSVGVSYTVTLLQLGGTPKRSSPS